MNFFNGLGLEKPQLDAIQDLGFETPTPIQEGVIPFVLKGKDILGSAQTGTGKTAAYGLPIASRLFLKEIRAVLVVVPTRELAMQTMKAMLSFVTPEIRKKKALLISGKNMREQLADLKKNPAIIVGTPGRINDHLRRGTLTLDKVNCLVLDETDRMLDMGFSIQIDEIVQFLPEQRQTLLFSATFPKNILRLTEKYLNDPEKVMLKSETLVLDRIDHQTFHVEEEKKYDRLVEELQAKEGSVVVFVNKKRDADKIAFKLRQSKEQADAIHGDLKHTKRAYVVQKFRDKKLRVMVATDVAARGLDIPHVEHVINYDIPMCPEDYIHRIGRTARAGKTGTAICFISSSQRKKWQAVNYLINPHEKTTEKKSSERDDFKKSGRKFGSKKTSKPFGTRRFDDRKSEGSFDDRKPSKPFGNKRFDDRKSEGSFDDRKLSKPFGSRRFDDRKSEGSFDDRKPSKPFGNKRFDDRKSEGSFDDRKPSKPFGDKKFGDRKSERFFDEKKSSKPFGDKKFGDKKQQEKSFSKRVRKPKAA